MGPVGLSDRDRAHPHYPRRMNVTDLVTAEELAHAFHVDASDRVVIDACGSANTLVLAYITRDVDHSTHPNCRLAAFTLAVDIYSNALAPGGEVMGPDYTPISINPYRMGASLAGRVSGLLAPCATDDVG